MWTLIFLLFVPGILAIEQTSVGELFTFKIEPTLFNWTTQVNNEEFQYRASIAGYPDLPSWMRYMYSLEHHAGFLYGTPPERYADKSLHLDIVALNKANYETRQMKLSIYVTEKLPAPNVIQMKIDNLNWVHLMDPGRVENLLNIFRHELWPESAHDLSLTFMESAVNMGGRVPLRPQQREGVIAHLGSFARFSPRLKELQEEVRPLYKLPTCTYKRTSVQKIFENAGFKLDWCAFKMVGMDISPEILFHNHPHGNKLTHEFEMNVLKRTDRWRGMSRDEVPTRNYIDEIALSFAVPGMIFAVLFGLLVAVLCFQHEKLFDPVSEFYFKHLFFLCEEFCQKPAETESEEEPLKVQHLSKVQMVHCMDTNKTATSTALSLKDPNCVFESVSLESQSPNIQIETAATGTRPKPPPYKTATLGRNLPDK